MINKQNESTEQFYTVLQKLKEEGVIGEKPAPDERQERLNYIIKLTNLFRKRIYHKD
tara:strand:+ start:223 stop:393 length:171 start_codon:yes stop_codon:yes gene_type:complete